MGQRKSLLRRLCEDQNGQCFYCGRPKTWSMGRAMATLDHYPPLARGGTHDPDNLVASCYRCNQWKADEDGDTFRLRMERKRR